MTIALDPIARNASLMAAYLEEHDVTRLREDATFVDATSGLRWQGRDAIAGMMDAFYRVAFDGHLDDSHLIVGMDGAVLEATFVGRHLAEFAGVAATGREVRVPLVIVYDLEAGEIAGARVHFSVASFLAQTAGNGREAAR